MNEYLALAREHLNATLTEQATWSRPAAGGGSFTAPVSPAEQLGTLPCARRALSGAEATTAEKYAPYATTAVKVPYGTDVRPGDTLEIAGTVYQVQFVPQATYGGLLRLLCAGGQ